MDDFSTKIEKNCEFGSFNFEFIHLKTSCKCWKGIIDVDITDFKQNGQPIQVDGEFEIRRLRSCHAKFIAEKWMGADEWTISQFQYEVL